jgi:hypothetical protein
MRLLIDVHASLWFLADDPRHGTAAKAALLSGTTEEHKLPAGLNWRLWLRESQCSRGAKGDLNRGRLSSAFLLLCSCQRNGARKNQ